MTHRTVIAGGTVVSGGVARDADVAIEGDRIVEVVEPGLATGDDETIDATGCWVSPGWIDLQLNGGWGIDFTTEPERIDAVAQQLPATGVTAFLPTIVTSEPARRTAAIEAMAAVRPHDRSAVALGLHLEGPILNAARAGAHERRWIAWPDDVETAQWSPHDGVVMVTLAPEVDGAVAVVQQLAQRGVLVAAGHTECTAAQFADAVDAGMTMVTHLFNAMAPLAHRSPGPVGATLADDRVTASLICDGIHVDPTVIRLAWRSLGPHRTVLVTDATAALGVTTGTVRLGHVDVAIDGDQLRTADGALAGSNLTLDRAVRNLVTFTGCSVPDALATVTATPARLLGIDDRGAVAPGARADLVVLDSQLAVQRTIVGGLTAWEREWKS